MIEKVNLSGLRAVLRGFDANGRAVFGTQWQIAKGGYSLWWQLSFQRVPVVNCIGGSLENCGLSESEFRRVCRVICEVYTEIAYPYPEAPKENPEIKAEVRNSVYQIILDALPDSPPRNETGRQLWQNGESILCRSEDAANALADVFDALGYTSTTGYYDPKEDEESGLSDSLTGWWYVDV